MKYLTEDDRKQLVGEYFAPEGLYEYTKSLPFLGRVTSNASTLVAGEWKEFLLDYEVGGSGLADGAWIKATFKFYSVGNPLPIVDLDANTFDLRTGLFFKHQTRQRITM